MKLKYLDFIQQTYNFPQEEFTLDSHQLYFHKVPLLDMVKKFGTPLKFTYLPKISENISKVKYWFQKAIQNHGYGGQYHYCYCTKSSHFQFVLDEALKNDIALETSFSTDLQIIEHLASKGKFDKNKAIVCNGFKMERYLEAIVRLRNAGFRNVIPVFDNENEIVQLGDRINQKTKVGLRIASEEEPKFEFYTSRLGIGYKDIIPFYKNHIRPNKNLEMFMLHFFINTGIRDTAYYWNELRKCLNIYVQLKKECPALKAFNIGGGFPVKNSLAFEYDYAYMVNEIVQQIQMFCQEAKVDVPDIYTEFGSFTVAESGGALYKVVRQKRQNDRERWNMIDSSFMTNMPDSWALSKRFILLPLHRWSDEYERVFLGGITCDSDDYYNSEQHVNAIYLPKYSQQQDLYIGFFNTGAYQETLGGYGGLQHCLVPNPKHILIQKRADGTLEYEVFSEEQTGEQMMNLLGYSN